MPRPDTYKIGGKTYTVRKFCTSCKHGLDEDDIHDTIGICPYCQSISNYSTTSNYKEVGYWKTNWYVHWLFGIIPLPNFTEEWILVKRR